MPIKNKFRKSGTFDIKIDFEKEAIFNGEVSSGKLDDFFIQIKKKFR